MNIQNGKRWIGETFNLDVSKYGQFYMLRKNTHPSKEFIKDYEIYGEKSFHFSILEIVNDISILRDRFDFYINLFKPEYNLPKKYSQIDTP
jgi:hypothetical protein